MSTIVLIKIITFGNIYKIRVMNFWKTFLACLLALLVSGIVSLLFSFIVLVGFVSILGSAVSSSETVANVKPNSVLHIDFGMAISDNPTINPFDNVDVFSMQVKRTTSLNGLISKIKRAKDDSRINGIYMEFPISTSLSMDAVYQLRTALEDFKTSQKFLISYSDAYSQGAYYLASVADKVYLNPQGAAEWKGISMEVMLYRNLLNKLGIEPEIFRHGKFKGAVEPFLYDKISDENRLQLDVLIGSIWGDMVSNVSKSRGVSVDDLQKYATDLSVRLAEDAVNLKFVDSLAYSSGVRDRLAVLAGDGFKPNMVNISEYLPSSSAKYSSDRVAVLYAVGDIVDGVSDGSTIASKSFSEQIIKLADNENVKAVVLRVNSPGGSALASEVILDELRRLKTKKPLVVSMGNYAASGGYYISCFGDKIIADPATLTGSIGVFGMLFNVEKGAKDILGINVDVVKTNSGADLGNMFRPITEVERAYIQQGVEQVYGRFTEVVAEGRGLDIKFVDSIAQGRVWSGLQAKELGLVDQLGTLGDAVNVAAELAGVDDYSISIYPKVDDNPFSVLFKEAYSVGVKVMGLGDSPEAIMKKKLEQLSTRQGVLVRLPYELEVR